MSCDNVIWKKVNGAYVPAITVCRENLQTTSTVVQTQD